MRSMRGAGGGCGWQDRREVETGGERSLRLREEPCGEEQAEIIGGQQSMRCDGILKSVKDRFWHAGGERGQFQILNADWKKEDSALL